MEKLPMKFQVKKDAWFHAKGRGFIAPILRPEDYGLSELFEAVMKKGGAGVEINDIPVTVTGIELFLPSHPVGLLVQSRGVCPICPHRVPVFGSTSSPICANGHSNIEPTTVWRAKEL